MAAGPDNYLRARPIGQSDAHLDEVQPISCFARAQSGQVIGGAVAGGGRLGHEPGGMDVIVPRQAQKLFFWTFLWASLTSIRAADP